MNENKRQRILYLGLECPVDRNVFHFPIIEIIPADPASEAIQAVFKSLMSFTHLIFTSKTAVGIFVDFLSLFAYKPVQLAQHRIIAVGAATAHRLKQRGVHVDIIAENETAEGIIEVLKGEELDNAKVLWPHSALSRSLIADFLSENAIPCCSCILYDTVPRSTENRPDLANFEEIVFTSPSCVEAFKLMYGAIPQDKKITAIGPITEKALGSIL